MEYNSQKSWSKSYNKQTLWSYPPEYVIRIFRGKYPNLNLGSDSFSGKKIGDIGCGDGRNLSFLQKCNLDVHGVEITKDIIQLIEKRLHSEGSHSGINLSIGYNHSLPFSNNYLDYLLSWNACYYMGNWPSFDDYVQEFYRVLKPGGTLILSIPKKTCFIYEGSSDCPQRGAEYRVIKKDPFGIRNGEVLRCFQGEKDIKKTFANFSDFTFASIEDDCFGYAYHWHLVICKKGK